MHARLSFLTVIFCLGAQAPGLGADKPAEDDIAVLRDIPYREGASQHWRLDLAMKKDLSGKPRPGIVVVHGGGWLEGDKSSFVFRERTTPANIVDFAKLGFVDHCPHSLVGIPELPKVVDEFFLRTLMHPATAREVRRRKG